MNCPVCRRPLVAQRTGVGVTIPCRSSRQWVVSGTCPHEGCRASLFSWTPAPDETPSFLSTGDGFLAWRSWTRPAVLPHGEWLAAFVVAMVMATFVALAAWAMWRTLELSPDLTSRVIFGVGPALVVLSQVGFAWLGVREAVQIRLRDELIARSAPDAPHGLALKPDPQTYRG